MRRWVALGVVFLSSACTSFAAEAKRMELVMGTLLEIKAEAENPSEAEQALEAGFKEVRRWDNLLSNYKNDSELSRINREAYPESTPTTKEMIVFLKRARELSQETSGYFEIMIEPLSQVWGAHAQSLDQMPETKAVNKAAGKAKNKYLEIYETDNTVRFLVEGCSMDSGGIGKGYAMDRALEKMRQFSIRSASLNFGGQILYWPLSGDSKFAVKNPLEPNIIWDHFSLSQYPSKSASVSTSANYERSFSVERYGKKKTIGHILNPMTGKPADNEVRSVTVVSTDATRADALSTALFVMGVDRAKTFLKERPMDWALMLYVEGASDTLKSFSWGNWESEK